MTLIESFEPYDQSVLEVTKNVSPTQELTQGVEKLSEKMSVKRSEKILELLAAEPRVTISELAVALGVATRTIERNLGVLQDSGRLRRMGPDKGGHWEVLK